MGTPVDIVKTTMITNKATIDNREISLAEIGIKKVPTKMMIKLSNFIRGSKRWSHEFPGIY